MFISIRCIITMKALYSTSVLLLLMVLNTHSYCPPGFIQNKTEEDSTGVFGCVCEQSLDGIIDCDEASGVARLAIGYCMSFHSATNSTLVGRCPFNSRYNLTELGTVSLYVTLPEDVNDLTEFFCGQYNRHNLFCTMCSNLHESSMTSYSQECIPCGEKHRKWGRAAYFFIQITPVTIIYALIIVFDIRFTTSPWSVFIFYSQVIVSMLNYDRHLYSGLLYISSKNKLTDFLMKTILALYGFWNLDFIPNIFPDFCLDIPKHGRHELAYQFLVALYPLVLIALIYFCVHLYSRDVSLVAVPWRAIKYCMNCRVCCGLKYLLQRISSQSIAHSFSSFLVLAHSKILFASLDILLPIQIYKSGSQTSILGSLFSPEKRYFASDRLPYMTCAIVILIIFSLIPTLLIIVYPLCVAKCCRTPLSVRLFLESFNGWFKDGTQEGTRDFRVLAGLHPVLRILLAVSISLNIVFVRPLSPLANHQWLIPGLVFLLCSVFFALARPYKLLYMNQCESALFALLGTVSLLVSSHLGLYFASILGTIPIVVLISYIMYKILKKLKKYFQPFHYKQQSHIRDILLQNFNADRLENPVLYQISSFEVSNTMSANIESSPASTYGTF